MNTYLKKLEHPIREIYSRGYTWYTRLPRLYQIITVIIVVIVTAIILRAFFSRSVPITALAPINSKVTLASVSTLSNIERDFPLVGTVTSVSEATIRSESSGRLTRVYKKLGDSVYAGGIIAEFDNSGERASLLQAEGAYEQAKAARSITRLNSGQADTSLNDTKKQAVNTIISAYATMDDAVRGKADTSFTDPKFEQVRLLLSIPDANLATSLAAKRKTIEKLLNTREEKNKIINENSDLLIELTTIQNEAQIIKLYLDDLYTAYSKGIADSNFNQAAIDAGKANVQIARQSISGTIAGLVVTRTGLNASMAANQVAGNGSPSAGSIATADAQVKQALGAYDAAAARLEKTVIRSPITGTLNSLSISTGDYIGSFTQVAVVSNNGALEVLSFVTEDDAKRITVGSPVSIDTNVQGVVTRIASAIDPTTKKIEVRIGIKDVKSSLINGQSVSINITKNKQNLAKNPNAPIVIPLSALKLTPYGANVFTLSASSTLVAVPVKEGAILGEQIQILDGLRGDENIVVDARGLKEGQTVVISQESSN
jgi:multidrug efflux pump subunit AcrA (membrane-fusion protein)